MIKERILVVDDEAPILDMTGKMLRQEGFDVVKMDNGKKALEILHKEEINLLLTDIRMPGINGMDILELYKKGNSNGAAVIMTGYGTIDMTIKAIGVGAHGFVLKPFTKADLLMTVERALQNVRLLREQERTKNLLPLFEVSKFLTHKSDVDELLNAIVDVAVRESGADHASITILDENSFVVKAAIGEEKGVETDLLLPITKKVTESGVPVLLRDDDPESAALYKILRRDVLSAIAVPLKVKNEVLGVLNVTKLKNSHPHFGQGDLEFMTILAGQAAVAFKNVRLVSDLEDLFLGTVKSLSSAIDAKSPWTAGHSERVTSYAILIGKKMGLSESKLKTLEMAGILHDIGKIGTNEDILNKEGKLTEEECEIVKQHPRRGGELIVHVKQLNDLMPAVIHHHENYNGTGYPDGLKGEEIPLLSRILTVADAYDAMKADRPYRKGRTTDFITDEFKRCSEIKFDPMVVESFLKIMEGNEWKSVGKVKSDLSKG